MTKTSSNILGTLSIKVITSIISFTLSILMARYLSVSDMGYYHISITILTTAVIISKLGLDKIILKYTSTLHKEQKWVLIYKFKKITDVVLFCSSLIVTIILFIFSDKISELLLGSSESGFYIRLVSVFVFPAAILQLNSERIVGIGNIILGSFLQSMSIVLLNMLIILMLFILGIKKELLVLFSYLISILISFLISTIFLRIKIKKKIIVQNENKIIEIHDFNNLPFFNIKTLLSQSLPLMWVTSMNLILGYMDIYMLGIYKGPEEVALYSIASKIVLMSSMVLVAFNTIISPKIAVYHSLKNFTKIEAIIQKTTLILFVIGIIIQLFLIIFGKFILSFYGTQYLSSYSAFIILSIGQFSVLATGPVASFLVMTNNQKIHKNSVFISVILNLGLNFILVPNYGFIGAALATSISILIKNIIEVLYCKFKFNLNIYLNWKKIILEAINNVRKK